MSLAMATLPHSSKCSPNEYFSKLAIFILLLAGRENCVAKISLVVLIHNKIQLETFKGMLEKQNVTDRGIGLGDVQLCFKTQGRSGASSLWENQLNKIKPSLIPQICPHSIWLVTDTFTQKSQGQPLHSLSLLLICLRGPQVLGDLGIKAPWAGKQTTSWIIPGGLSGMLKND